MKLLSSVLYLLALTTLCSSNALVDGYFDRGTFTNIYDTCQAVQTEEKFFTGSCHLGLNDVAPNLDDVKAFVTTYAAPTTTNIDKFLTDAFSDSTKWFQTTYPNYNTQYKSFEQKLRAVMDKLKISTKDVKMVDFRTVITESGMNTVYNAIIQNTNPRCPPDSKLCPDVNAMLNISSTELSTQTVNDFLTKAVENAFNFLKPAFSNDQNMINNKALVMEFVNKLNTDGTNGVMVQPLQRIFESEFFTRIRNNFDPKITTGTTRRTRTTTTTVIKTTKEKVPKTTPGLYVKPEVYITVPLVLLFIGIVLCVLVIVFYYRMTPYVGKGVRKLEDEDLKAKPKEVKF